MADKSEAETEQSLNESYQRCPEHGIVYDTDVVDECPLCKQVRDMKAKRVGGP